MVPAGRDPGLCWVESCASAVTWFWNSCTGRTVVTICAHIMEGGGGSPGGTELGGYDGRVWVRQGRTNCWALYAYGYDGCVQGHQWCWRLVNVSSCSSSGGTAPCCWRKTLACSIKHPRGWTGGRGEGADLWGRRRSRGGACPITALFLARTRWRMSPGVHISVGTCIPAGLCPQAQGTVK